MDIEKLIDEFKDLVDTLAESKKEVARSSFYEGKLLFIVRRVCGGNHAGCHV